MGDNESDDDVPIAELLRRKKQQADDRGRQAAALPAKRKEPEPAPAPKKRQRSPKKTAPAKEDSGSDEDEDEEGEGPDQEADEEEGEEQPRQRQASAPAVKRVSESRSDYYSCKKGFIAQKLLVRWWYAIEWPPADIIPKPKPGFESLEGFPGVFISTRQDTLGVIDDIRIRETKPCLSNFKEMPSCELQRLCVRAYEEQIRQLIGAEGPGTALELTLRSELKEVESVDAAEADRESSRLESKRSSR